jgi:hypothetical protein
MGHRSSDRDPLRLTGQHIARRVEAGQVGAAGDLESGVGPVSAAQAEVDQPAPARTSTQRAALLAMIVWKWIWLTIADSTSCASISGAVTSISGSSGKQTVPSGRARTDPVKRRFPSSSRNCGEKWPVERRQARSASSNASDSRYVRTSSRPAAR